MTFQTCSIKYIDRNAMINEYIINPNTQGVLAPHLTKGGGHIVPPPLKSPKSNIFGQGKLGQAITNYYKAFGRKKLQKHSQKNVFEKIFFSENIFHKIFFSEKKY